MGSRCQVDEPMVGGRLNIAGILRSDLIEQWICSELCFERDNILSSQVKYDGVVDTSHPSFS